MDKENNRPLILIGNDDGYNSAGITELIKIARRFGDVVVAAPLNHQSGKSCAISMDVPLRVKTITDEPGLTVYAISGTPADCLKLGLDKLLGGRTPDLVLSGINHGYNTGISTLYSGTMGVAFEGLVHHIPSVAFSYGSFKADVDFTPCLGFISHIVDTVIHKGLPQGICLNVNFPKCEGEIKGVKVTTTDMGLWVREFEKDTDPFGNDYYWMTGTYQPADENDHSTDIYWIEQGYATITPVKIDQTSHDHLREIAEIFC
ncbi:MAG: 5'/3'-nucleotidase SurE [Muribaculaceae bacterium]|nr:5'/3'-nucleotidase SurE [Muribaculaceae bacterium]